MTISTPSVIQMSLLMMKASSVLRAWRGGLCQHQACLSCILCIKEPQTMCSITSTTFSSLHDCQFCPGRRNLGLWPSRSCLTGGRKWSSRKKGAPAHTVRVTQQWCVEQLSGFLPKEEQPLNSPDQNIIEKSLGILNSLVFTSPPPATTKQLNSLAKRGWDKIEPFVLENVIHSIPDKTQSC